MAELQVHRSVIVLRELQSAEQLLAVGLGQLPKQQAGVDGKGLLGKIEEGSCSGAQVAEAQSGGLRAGRLSGQLPGQLKDEAARQAVPHRLQELLGVKLGGGRGNVAYGRRFHQLTEERPPPRVAGHCQMRVAANRAPVAVAQAQGLAVADYFTAAELAQGRRGALAVLRVRSRSARRAGTLSVRPVRADRAPGKRRGTLPGRVAPDRPSGR